MEHTSIYNVRRPSLKRELIFLSSITGIQIFNLSIFQTRSNRTVLYLGSGVLLLFCFIAVLMLVYRIFTIPRFIDFQIQSDTLLIEEIKVNAMNIEVIYVKGYFRPVIGIKPITDTLVPYKLCFSFLEDDEHKAMKQLKAWAEQNQIEVIYKSFSRWL